MPGATPKHAVDAFLDPTREVLNCFSDSIFLRGGHIPERNPHVAILGDDSPVELDSAAPDGLAMHFTHHYNVIKVLGRRRDPWRVTTIAYIYRLETRSGRRIIEYHWHPRTTPSLQIPHLHVRAPVTLLKDYFSKAHLPTGRISIEDFIEMAVTEFDVRPRPQYQHSWQGIVKRTRAAYEAHRSWGGRT